MVMKVSMEVPMVYPMEVVFPKDVPMEVLSLEIDRNSFKNIEN
jgi:hypothetical protein